MEVSYLFMKISFTLKPGESISLGEAIKKAKTQSSAHKNVSSVTKKTYEFQVGQVKAKLIWEKRGAPDGSATLVVGHKQIHYVNMSFSDALKHAKKDAQKLAAEVYGFYLREKRDLEYSKKMHNRTDPIAEKNVNQLKKDIVPATKMIEKAPQEFKNYVEKKLKQEGVEDLRSPRAYHLLQQNLEKYAQEYNREQEAKVKQEVIKQEVKKPQQKQQHFVRVPKKELIREWYQQGYPTSGTKDKYDVIYGSNKKELEQKAEEMLKERTKEIVEEHKILSNIETSFKYPFYSNMGFFAKYLPTQSRVYTKTIKKEEQKKEFNKLAEKEQKSWMKKYGEAVYGLTIKPLKSTGKVLKQVYVKGVPYYISAGFEKLFATIDKALGKEKTAKMREQKIKEYTTIAKREITKITKEDAINATTVGIEMLTVGAGSLYRTAKLTKSLSQAGIKLTKESTKQLARYNLLRQAGGVATYTLSGAAGQVGGEAVAEHFFPGNEKARIIAGTLGTLAAGTAGVWLYAKAPYLIHNKPVEITLGKTKVHYETPEFGEVLTKDRIKEMTNVEKGGLNIVWAKGKATLKTPTKIRFEGIKLKGIHEITGEYQSYVRFGKPSYDIKTLHLKTGESVSRIHGKYHAYVTMKNIGGTTKVGKVTEYVVKIPKKEYTTGLSLSEKGLGLYKEYQTPTIHYISGKEAGFDTHGIKRYLYIISHQKGKEIKPFVSSVSSTTSMNVSKDAVIQLQNLAHKTHAFSEIASKATTETLTKLAQETIPKTLPAQPIALAPIVQINSTAKKNKEIKYVQRSKAQAVEKFFIPKKKGVKIINIELPIQKAKITQIDKDMKKESKKLNQINKVFLKEYIKPITNERKTFKEVNKIIQKESSRYEHFLKSKTVERLTQKPLETLRLREDQTVKSLVKTVKYPILKLDQLQISQPKFEIERITPQLIFSKTFTRRISKPKKLQKRKKTSFIEKAFSFVPSSDAFFKALGWGKDVKPTKKIKKLYKKIYTEFGALGSLPTTAFFSSKKKKSKKSKRSKKRKKGGRK